MDIFDDLSKVLEPEIVVSADKSETERGGGSSAPGY